MRHISTLTLISQTRVDLLNKTVHGILIRTEKLERRKSLFPDDVSIETKSSNRSNKAYCKGAKYTMTESGNARAGDSAELSL